MVKSRDQARAGAGAPGAPPLFSIVIPAYNAAETLGECLASIFASTFSGFEVIVVDDASSDGSAACARSFPVTLVSLPVNQGPSLARNSGAERARGRFLLFTDADCLFEKELLDRARRRIEEGGATLFGGTYDPRSAEGNFYGDFQALYDFYHETKEPDANYLAAHLLVIEKDLFRRVGGFHRGEFVGRDAGCEDLDLSYRLKSLGCRLPVYPELRVKHYFGFGLYASLRNAAKKSYLWAQFLLAEKLLFSDAGVGSTELKANAALAILLLCGAGAGLAGRAWGWAAAGGLFALMLAINRRFLLFVARERNFLFALRAAVYLLVPYALSVGAGGFLLLCQVPFRRRLRRK